MISFANWKEWIHVVLPNFTFSWEVSSLVETCEIFGFFPLILYGLETNNEIRMIIS